MPGFCCKVLLQARLVILQVPEGAFTLLVGPKSCRDILKGVSWAHVNPCKVHMQILLVGVKPSPAVKKVFSGLFLDAWNDFGAFSDPCRPKWPECPLTTWYMHPFVWTECLQHIAHDNHVIFGLFATSSAWEGPCCRLARGGLYSAQA